MTTALISKPTTAEREIGDSDVESPTADASPAPLPIAGLATTAEKAGPPSKSKKKNAKKKAKKLAEKLGGVTETASPATPVGVELTKDQRRAKVKTLTEDDKQELAAEWSYQDTDPRFVFATTVEKSYQFVRKLTALQRILVRTDQVEQAQQLAAKKWDEMRRSTVSTMTDGDKAYWTGLWNLEPDDGRLKTVFDRQESLDYFIGLSPGFREVVSRGQVKQCTPETAELLKKGRKARQDAAEAAKAKLKDEQEAAATKLAKEKQAAAQEQNKQDFAGYRVKLKDEISKALTALGIPDDRWAAEYAASADARATTIEKQATAKLATQTSGLKGEWDKRIAREQKKVDVDKELANHADLRLGTKSDLRKQVMGDDALSVAWLAKECTAKMDAQRNPPLTKWIDWMQLTMFRSGKAATMKKLTMRLTYPAHFSVDESGLSRPGTVTDATTPAQLLDQLFRAPSGKKFQQAHVALETGVASAEDALKNPHKYWRGAGVYELFFGKNKEYRWTDVTHTEDNIRDALDEAMQEVTDLMLARAAVVLADKGRTM